MLKKINKCSAALLLIILFVFTAFAQETIPASMSSADVMRERIAKARAYIVVKNFSAAIYELDNIKRESADPTVHGVANVLLMNSYLEQTDYKRAINFLNDLSKDLKANKPNAAANYFAVASQVIKNSKSQLERYRALGFNISDPNLPAPALADADRMREILEVVVNQSKELGKTAKDMDNTMALIEGATNARSNFAKDEYDANRWKTEVTDAREQLTNSRSTVINAVTVPQGPENTVASNTIPPINPSKTEQSAILLPVSKESPVIEEKSLQPEVKNSEAEIVAKTQPILKPVETQKDELKKTGQTTDSEPTEELKRNRVIIGSAAKPEITKEEEKPKVAENIEIKNVPAKITGPMDVGSLVVYATRKTTPVYPSVARSMRMSGIVKVEVVIDEDGRVAEVQTIDGPVLLQTAAQDAIRKWRFKPFLKDGEPVKAAGYVSFNFNL